MLQYLRPKSKGNGAEDAKVDTSQAPFLNDEDEAFFTKIASEGTALSHPQRPTIILDNGQKVRGKDAQIALMAGADKIALPASPPEGAPDATEGTQKQRTNYWNLVPGLPQAGS